MYRRTLLGIILGFIIISCGSNNNSSTADPAITSMQPDSGPPGTVVTILGNGFASQASGNEVKFNGTATTVTDAAESELVVTVPNGATSGAISVTVGQKNSERSKFHGRSFGSWH